MYGWSGEAIGSDTAASTFVIEGDADRIYAGGVVLSDADLDGDGTGDLVVQAALDGRMASNGGSVGVFFDPAGLSGSISYADADTMFTISEPGASLAPIAIGDADDDGVDDLGFEMEPLVYPKPNGVLFADVPLTGQHEVLSEGTAVLYACGPAGTADIDGDGGAELLALSGGVMQLELPLSGAVYPWEAAVATSAFGTDPAQWIGQIEPALPYWDGRRMLSASFVYDDERGAVALDVLRPGMSTDLELAKYLLLGEQPGDLLGMTSALLDADMDGTVDLLLGAPGFDGASANAGAVYLIPGPR